MTENKTQPQTKSIKYVKPKTKGQAEYIRSIAENDITMCSGPAGSGKTACSVLLACQYYAEQRIDKILITRPIVGVSIKSLGALPGDLKEKYDPYLVPIIEEMYKYFEDKHLVDKMVREKKIESCPLELMRGRTFDNTFLILDEAQNCMYEQLKMFLTRIGDGSKMVINGDTDQTDLKYEAGGFDRVLSYLDGIEGIGVVTLTQADIVRNQIIKRILGALGNG